MKDARISEPSRSLWGCLLLWLGLVPTAWAQQTLGSVNVAVVDTFYLHGPPQTFTDVGVSKAVPITSGIRFKFQMEMLNAFNHPTFFGNGTNGVTTGLASTGFGRVTQTGTSRRIEFRANVEF